MRTSNSSMSRIRRCWSNWTRRTLTCGIALQCSPSKDRLTEYRLNELSTRELRALTLVEAGIALGWIASRWPGLLTEMRRVLPDVEAVDTDMDAIRRCSTVQLLWQARGKHWDVHPLLGRLPFGLHACRSGLTDKLRRQFGRMPWTTTQKRLPRPYSVPVGGDGGVRNPNLPPPSRPRDARLGRLTRAVARGEPGQLEPGAAGRPDQRVSRRSRGRAAPTVARIRQDHQHLLGTDRPRPAVHRRLHGRKRWVAQPDPSDDRRVGRGRACRSTASRPDTSTPR